MGKAPTEQNERRIPLGFLTQGMTARAYFFLSVAVALGLLAAVSALGVRAVFFDELFGYQILYNYQLQKIAGAKNVDTLLVGDSSLGNAIDAEYFSELTDTRSVNVALTGMYGYAGAYNMLKKMENHPIRNVVIMCSLDTQTRGVCYGGYLLTLSGWNDIKELDRLEQGQLIEAFYDQILASGNFKAAIRSLLGVGRRRFEVNADYIQQGNPIDPDSLSPLAPGAMVRGKDRFLKKLRAYCETRGIRVIHVHGPYSRGVVARSQAYVQAVEGRLKAVGIRHLTDLKEIPRNELGDSGDHVAPPFKRAYTEHYARLLGASFKSAP